MNVHRWLPLVAALVAAAALVPLSSARALDRPGDQTVEATESGGAHVSWDDTGETCDPTSGSLFPLGGTTVNCTDADGNFSFGVTVQDTTAPSFGSLSDVNATAPDSSGTTVTYTTPNATDAVSGSIPGDCVPASGSHFDVGTTHVVCSATDGAGHTGTAGFDVIVSFDQPPTDQPPTLNLPSVPDVHTTNPGGTQVIYSATANDQEDGALTPTCAPASGSTFSVATTTVGCSVTDSGGHTVTGSFSVTVILDSAPPPGDTTPPVISNVPADIHSEANGPNGSVANFATPSAADDVDGPIAVVTCAPASGSTFPLGTTTVTCSATDSAGNTGSATFSVSVIDATPPHLIPPGDRSVYATTPGGIAATDTTAAEFLNGASVTDIADPHPTVSTDAPSFLLVGATDVKFTARDASGNVATAEARLTVLPMPAPGTTPPPLPPPADRTPPDDVTDLVATPGDGLVTLKWTKPNAADFDHVLVSRSETTVGAEATTVYTGKDSSFADTGVRNGVEYRYVVAAIDRAGNRSGGVVIVAVPSAALLVAPKSGARVKKTVKFRWRAVKDAKYYNLQLFRGGTRVLASAADTKVLSVWPVRPTYVLKQKWKYLRKRYALTPGVYTWYVWPGFGPRSAAEYGQLVGSSTFTVVR